VNCKAVTDAGMRFIARTPCLINLTLQSCNLVTDGGVAELVHAQKLESVIIEGCPWVSLQVAEGVARSVQYSDMCASPAQGLFYEPQLWTIAEDKES
jgi:F-box/leucine-rich repeat protein 2/20